MALISGLANIAGGLSINALQRQKQSGTAQAARPTSGGGLLGAVSRVVGRQAAQRPATAQAPRQQVTRGASRRRATGAFSGRNQRRAPRRQVAKPKNRRSSARRQAGAVARNTNGRNRRISRRRGRR